MTDLTLLETIEIVRLQLFLNYEDDFMELTMIEEELDFRLDSDSKYKLVKQEMERIEKKFNNQIVTFESIINNI